MEDYNYPHLSVKPQDLAPFLKVRLLSFNGPVPSTTLDKVVFIYAYIISLNVVFVNYFELLISAIFCVP